MIATFSFLFSHLLGVSNQSAQTIAPQFDWNRSFDNLLRPGDIAQIVRATQTARWVEVPSFRVSERGVRYDEPRSIGNRAVHERFIGGGVTYDLLFLFQGQEYAKNQPILWNTDYLQPVEINKKYLVIMNKWDGSTGLGVSVLHPECNYTFDLSKTGLGRRPVYFGLVRIPWLRNSTSITPKEIMLNLLEGCRADDVTAKECLQILYGMDPVSNDRWFNQEFSNLASANAANGGNQFLRMSLARIAYKFGGTRYRDQFLKAVSDPILIEEQARNNDPLRKWMSFAHRRTLDLHSPRSYSNWSKTDPLGYAKAAGRVIGDSHLFTMFLDLAGEPTETKVLDLYASYAIHSQDPEKVIGIALTLFRWTNNPNLRIDHVETANVSRLRQALKDIYPNAEKIPPIREGD